MIQRAIQDTLEKIVITTPRRIGSYQWPVHTEQSFIMVFVHRIGEILILYGAKKRVEQVGISVASKGKGDTIRWQGL